MLNRSLPSVSSFVTRFGESLGCNRTGPGLVGHEPCLLSLLAKKPKGNRQRESYSNCIALDFNFHTRLRKSKQTLSAGLGQCFVEKLSYDVVTTLLIVLDIEI